MAIHAPIMGPATLASPVKALLSHFDRAQLEGFVEAAIGLLDAIDGDPDCELNGDEDDHSGAEDDFVDWRGLGFDYAAGCPISDPDLEHDGREEQHQLSA